MTLFVISFKKNCFFFEKKKQFHSKLKKLEILLFIILLRL